MDQETALGDKNIEPRRCINFEHNWRQTTDLGTGYGLSI